MMEIEINQPGLRFRGFSEPWKTSSLGGLSKLITKGTTPSSFSDDGVTFVKIESLNGQMIEKKQCAFITKEIHEKELRRSQLEDSDILFAIAGATVGKVGIVKNDILPANTNQALAIIRLLDKELIAFVLQILTSRAMKKYIYQSVSVGAQPNLSLKQISDFVFFVPSLPEQQKIASFLSSVDERIEFLERKKEKLEAYKKGVMQQIFSQQIRFKPARRGGQDDGSAFPDWEEKRFSDLYEFKSTNSFSREQLNYEKGSHLNIHYGDIHTKFNTLLDLRSTKLPFVNEQVLLKKQMRDNVVSEGDLIIADASEDYKDIGKTVEVYKLSDAPVLAGLHTIHAALKDRGIEIGFGGYLMKSSGLRKQIMRIAQGTKVLSISATRVGELIIKVPCMEEQKKIVTFLQSIDESINQLNRQIQGLRTWKKGLLQQMFV